MTKKNNLYKITKKEEKIFQEIAQEFGTPAYVYFQSKIEKQIKTIQRYKAPYGLTVRFAMKASPNLSILKLMDKNRVCIDASTYQEAYRAIEAGINPEKILLTSQQFPNKQDFVKLIKKGVQYNATSINQLKLYGENFPNTDISIRFNIGIGSSWTAKMDTGGLNSSFGIFEKFEEIKKMLEKYNLNLIRFHMHIGSGSDPKKQTDALKKALKIIEKYETIKILNMGGGFKVSRVEGEKETNVIELSKKGEKILKDFYKKTGRKIKLEIEPGTFLVANAGYIVSKITDIVDTGENGMNYIKTDTGMNDNTRVALYGAQHPIYHIPVRKSKEKVKYVFSGECCESSDVLTCEKNNPEKQKAVEIKKAEVGDLIIQGGTGAYCAGMSLGNYNSKPRSAEVLVLNNGALKLIRKPQKIKDVWRNDILIDF